jgi:hypothetical protein
MKAIKTRPGLPMVWIWFFTITPAMILFWLPPGFMHGSLIIILAICSVSLAYPITTLLPRPHIMFVLGDSSVLSVDSEIKNNEVTLLELTDNGRLSGWWINFYTKWGNEPSMSIPLEKTENGESLISILPQRMPTATLQTKGLTWGRAGEWAVIISSTLLVVGIVKFLIYMFVA